MINRVVASRWLGALHTNTPGYTHICSSDNWPGATFATDQIEDALDYVVGLDRTSPEGIYARVSTVNGPLPRGKRGGVGDTAALPALWADIDIAGPGHAEDNLPPDEQAARRIIATSGLPEPTVWVASGGGFYPIWRFEQACTVGGDDDQLRAMSDLSANWQKIIGMAAQREGWHYGAGVGDLARVLRIPGTTNRKEGLERPCRLLGGGWSLYPVDELYRAAVDILGAVPETVKEVVPTRNHAPGTTSPGDAYAAANDWSDILEPHGWRLVYERSGVRYWRRPDKSTVGISATTNALGTDRLRVFSTSTAFAATSYSKFGAYAVLEHGGNHHTAARDLRQQGYGDPPAATPGGIIEVPLGEPGPGAEAGLMAELRHREEVLAEAHRIQVRREATRHVDAHEFETTWREPTSTFTLSQELELPSAPTAYRVDKLLPAGGNALLVAQFKAGKTTFCNNLVRCLADDEPFMGHFPVHPPDGRIAIFNYEIGADQYRDWLRTVGIRNLDRVCVLNIRGYRMPPTMPEVETWITKWLAERKVAIWIVDPFARAFVGCGDENSNTDVGVFLDALDVIKERAGVGELIMPSHAGRTELLGQEHARGASRLDDWADARWILTSDDQGRRFFRAHGRDVEVDEEAMQFDPFNQALTFGGWDREGMKCQDMLEDVVRFVGGSPGLGVNEIVGGFGGRRARVIEALTSAIAINRVVVCTGSNRKRLHYVPGAPEMLVAERG